MRTKEQSPADEPKEVDPMDDYETKNHLNTILDAHAIMSDPEKMKKVHKLAGRHTSALKGIKSIADLKALHNEKFGSKAIKKLGSSAMKSGLQKPESDNDADD